MAKNVNGNGYGNENVYGNVDASEDVNSQCLWQLLYSIAVVANAVAVPKPFQLHVDVDYCCCYCC